MAKAKATANSNGKGGKGEAVEIPPLGRDTARVMAVSLAPLIVHSMTAKARKEMLNKKEHKKAPRQPCDWRREYLESFYWMDNPEFLKVISDYDHDPTKDKEFAAALEDAVVSGMEATKTARFGVPAVAVKSAFVRGAKGLEGLDMVTTRGLLYVKGDFSEHAQMELIQILSKEPPQPVEHVISVKSGSRDLRWRPMWQQWALEFEIEYETEVFNDVGSVLNLGRRGGSRCGICEGRPEKSSLGWGRFDLK